MHLVAHKQLVQPSFPAAATYAALTVKPHTTAKQSRRINPEALPSLFWLSRLLDPHMRLLVEASRQCRVSLSLEPNTAQPEQGIHILQSRVHLSMAHDTCLNTLGIGIYACSA